MATVFYARSSASGATLPSSSPPYQPLELLLTRGAAATTITENTVAGVASGAAINEWGVGSASAKLTWVSNPLNAVTIAGTVSVNIRGLESNAMANYGVGVRIGVLAGGSITWVGGGTGTVFDNGVELGTTESARAFSAATGGFSIAQGAQLVIQFLWVATGGTTASGFTSSGFYAGPTAGASGDTYVTFIETITEATGTTPKTATESGTGTDTSSAETAAYVPTEAGAGTEVSTRAAVAADGYGQAVLATSGLLGYWRLGDPGAVAMDSKGTAVGAVQANVTNGVAGLAGMGSDTAMDFPATSATWISITHQTYQNPGSTDFSVELWVNPDVDMAAGVFRQLIGKVNPTSWQLQWNGVKMEFRVDTTAPTIFRCQSTANSPMTAAGGWYHVVGVRSGSTLFLYINGVQAGTLAVSGTLVTSPTNISVGALNLGAAEMFDGQIDEVAFYGVALDATTVADHYAAGQGSVAKFATESGTGSDASAAAGVTSATEAGAGADASTPAAALAPTESGVGTEVSAAVAPVQTTESGAGAEASATSATTARTESGTGTDAATDAARHTTDQSGTITDASTMGAAQSRPETGTGTDIASAAVPVVTTEAGTGSEASTAGATNTRAEAGTGADTATDAARQTTDQGGIGSELATQGATTSVSDTGAGTDTSTASAGAVANTASDGGTGTDAATPAASATRPETGAGSELATPTGTLSTGDAGAGTDASTETVAQIRPEAATGTDAGLPAVTFTGTDAASAVDASGLTASHALTDAASGADLALSLQAAITATDTGAGGDSGFLIGAGTFTRSESGIGSEASATSAGLAAVDAGAGGEATGVTVGLGRSEDGAAVDTAVVAITFLAVNVFESAVGSDVSVAVAASFTSADTGLGTDVAVKSELAEQVGLGLMVASPWHVWSSQHPVQPDEPQMQNTTPVMGKDWHD